MSSSRSTDRASDANGSASGNAGDGDDAALNQSRSQTPSYEWAVAAISALVVLGAIGFLLYEALVLPSGPARVVVQADSVIPVAEGYLVRYTAHNPGRSTAASVQIDGVLLDAGRRVESATATIDYLPVDARRTGALFFARDPRGYRLMLRPRGYSDP